MSCFIGSGLRINSIFGVTPSGSTKLDIVSCDFLSLKFSCAKINISGVNYGFRDN